MEIFTLNVGQGSFVVVREKKEAVIIDTRIPAYKDKNSIFVKGALTKILKGYNLIGLILTGFDKDHADATGVGLVVRKYRPDWVMYPSYYKKTIEANNVFSVLKSQTSMEKIPVRLDKIEDRCMTEISNEMDFEVFSPHPEDMDNSNNCSLVVKIDNHVLSYLVTGDTENKRWARINDIFGDYLQSDIMAAPHHGSKGAANEETIALINPHTILISAGPNNQFSHPHNEAMDIFQNNATETHSTHYGYTLHTYINDEDEIETSYLNEDEIGYSDDDDDDV